ncbi:tRNA pseudouridine(13) synthase TruD [Schlesneria sp.]|uniref:tRNA pseudouridine(13) synthase TruD n=1 Tax=Schlesneria sp. TaxID=2762018 RepID=UPI002F11D7F2
MPKASNNLPYFTADLPGIGGEIKVEPEDFVVEEIPAYEPGGEGQHLFLWLQKRDIPHDQLIRRLAGTLAVSPNDIGFAGIKDRRAVARQYVSVPISCQERVGDLNSDQITVLQATPHVNKLKTGHLRGNRFTIVIRNAAENALAVAESVVQRLSQFGFPNYYGDQRFGHDGETLKLGLDLLTGVKKPQEIPYSKRKFLLRLALSAVQSDLFNQALSQRLQEGLLHTVLEGDILEVTQSGGKFVSEDVTQEQARLDAGEVTVTGPMFGVKMLSPHGVTLERETKLLAESGLTLDLFQKYSQLLSGARRSFVARPAELETAQVSEGIQLKFNLPSGVYATTLLRELMKDDSAAAPAPTEDAADES